MTKIIALSDETFDASSFLEISRRFLGLIAKAPARPVGLAEIKPSPRFVFGSLASAKRRQCTANRYRKVAQSLLLATGLGAFIPGQAFANEASSSMSDRETRHERHAKLLAKHHQRLHDALHLSAEQESGWEKLLASEQPQQFVGAGRTTDWAMLSIPERAERMLELSKLRQAQLTEHVAALKHFYAMLTPDQKQIFEALHAGPPG